MHRNTCKLSKVWDACMRWIIRHGYIYSLSGMFVNSLLNYKMPYPSYKFDDAKLLESGNPVFLHWSHPVDYVYRSKALTDQPELYRFFRKHKLVKKSENSDNKTGDYSSFKIAKIYMSLCNLFGQKMESTLPKYAPSIYTTVDYPVYWTFKIILSSIGKCWFASLWVLFVLRFISDNVFIKGKGVSLLYHVF